jgi:adenosylmethionine-8-amino-7-oxononanoate aminotransferase
MTNDSERSCWKQWDHAYLWHPFTQMREWLAEDPIVIERAEGNYLIDSDGRRYFDGVSSLWCNVHGHGRRELVEAIRTQLDAVAHTTMLGLSNVPATVLAKKLIELAPRGLQRVFYSDSGATAVEIALKMAFEYWRLRGDPKRDHFVSLISRGHHRIDERGIFGNVSFPLPPAPVPVPANFTAAFFPLLP